MSRPETTYAFIDSQNLNLGVKDLGWNLDFAKFRRYLSDKFGVRPNQAFLFIGYIPDNHDLYLLLQKIGYIYVFKPTLVLADGKVKGDVDAELVLHTMIEYPNFSKAIIVTGDGDFRCLVEYLLNKDKLDSVIAPNSRKFSSLLKSLGRPDRRIFHFLNGLDQKLGKIQKEKGAFRDETLQGPFSS
ncbi:MAG: NYN domain-containing protein [Patescibacteria group bacterium]